MDREETEINIRSRFLRNDYKLTWCIENFDMMPFLDDHPVCGPYFLLGKKRFTTWSLLMSKQVHEGVENVGFKLVRIAEDAKWDMVTLSVSVKMEDGRLIKCIHKEVFADESEDCYVFLIKPSKSKHALKNGMDVSTQVENDRGLEGSLQMDNGSRFIDGMLEKAVKEAISNSNSIEISLSPQDENGRCHHGFVEPNVESCSCEHAEFKKSNEQEDTVTKPDAENGSPKVENGRSLVENGRGLKRSPKIESCRIKDSEVETNGVQQDGAELKSEDLFKIRDLTVVCRIEYTYLVYDNIAKNAKRLVNSDLMDVLKYLQTSGKFSDITLKCEDVQFPCHKAILSSRSSFFEELLHIGSLPTPLIVNLNMPLRIAKAFISYVYTGELPDGVSAEDCTQLSMVAKQFDVPGMKRSCQELVRSLEDDEDEESDFEEEEVLVKEEAPQPQSLTSIFSSAMKDQSLVSIVPADFATECTKITIPEAKIDASDTDVSTS